MKYEPASKTSGTGGNGPIEWLMMPFAKEDEETDWELIDLVREALSSLSEADQQALDGIFYQRQTYQELAATLNIRAKSHAWRKVESAMKNMQKAILNNDKLMLKLKEKYGI